MTAGKRTANRSNANVAYDTDSDWRDLGARYKHLREALEALGGSEGTEADSERLWFDVENLFQRMAKLRAHSADQLAQKLDAALDMIDEASDGGLRELLESAIRDLRSPAPRS